MHILKVSPSKARTEASINLARPVKAARPKEMLTAIKGLGSATTQLETSDAPASDTGDDDDGEAAAADRHDGGEDGGDDEDGDGNGDACDKHEYDHVESARIVVSARVCIAM